MIFNPLINLTLVRFDSQYSFNQLVKNNIFKTKKYFFETSDMISQPLQDRLDMFKYSAPDLSLDLETQIKQLENCDTLTQFIRILFNDVLNTENCRLISVQVNPVKSKCGRKKVEIFITNGISFIVQSLTQSDLDLQL
ncbi:hypothetical protein BpHYR1_047445 [Brachionus plicatilis]|uniref:Uncharacterized protein n=1 Tax=Brachionus plicatilis TaxID=10195 RepID=A0A3M7SER9_BRAPC|nr:hypothetical protein BpHYR1_047445 [Brachionus plicatilis]